MGTLLSCPKRQFSRYQKLESDAPLTEEVRLLEMFEHCFNFFKLEDLAKIISLNTRFMRALSQSPRILISMIKKFYMSQDHVHPKVRRYFQILFTKRPRIDISNLSGIAKEIYLLSEYRIKISKNLIRDVYCTKKKNMILETPGRYYGQPLPNRNLRNPLIERKHGGKGWDFIQEAIPEFRKGTFASSFEMCEISYKAFFKEFSPDFLEDFRNGRTVLKAGCFISRRDDCAANGGCVLQFFDSESRLILNIRQHKQSNEIPITTRNDFVYQEIAFIIPFKDYFSPDINLDDCYLKLIIYGRDERWWAGYYGSRFTAMYIRGDYNENPLKRLLN